MCSVSPHVAQRWPWHAAALGVACAGLLATGCKLTDGEVKRMAAEERIAIGSPDQQGAWLFWPSSVRIHRLTSVVRPAPKSDDVQADATSATTELAPQWIDLRVEALDETQQPTRAVGTFVIVLSSPAAQPSEQRWKADVSSLESHAKRFDAVTDTYRFDLTPEWTKAPARGEKLAIKVILYGANGTTPAATADLTW
jgi:hypothetical protein